MQCSRFPVAALSLALLASILGGCSAYDTRYAFEPRPAEAVLQAPDGSGVTVAQALASVVGVRRADPEEGFDSSVEVRLRIDNVSDRSMQFNPSSMSLLSADLQKFPPPYVEPAGTFQVTPETPVDVIAWFPFPDDPSRPPMDMSGLSVRWTLNVDDRPLPGSITVKRRRYRAPPHWLYGFHFGYSHAWHGGRRGHRHHYRPHFGFHISHY